MIVALESAGDADELKAFGRMVAMHVASANPQAVDPSGLDAATVEREKSVLAEKFKAQGKPANVIDKIVESGLKTFYKEVCLLDQGFIFDDKKSVAQALKESEGKVGAPIKITGFVRFALGEGIDRPERRFRRRSRGAGRRALRMCGRPCWVSRANAIALSACAGIGAQGAGTSAMAKPNYRRVIVKLSGEALSGPEKFGIHQPTIDRFAADLVAAHKLGIGLGVVVGGGNVLRGAQISENGLSRPTADAMGMLATVMNALVLEAAHRTCRRQRPHHVGAGDAAGLRDL